MLGLWPGRARRAAFDAADGLAGKNATRGAGLGRAEGAFGPRNIWECNFQPFATLCHFGANLAVRA